MLYTLTQEKVEMRLFLVGTTLNKFNHLKCDVYLNYIKLISYLLENTKRTHYKKNKLMLDMEKNLYLL